MATAAKDAAGWLAKETRTRFADARADLALATALDREHPVLAAAMREGDATLAQAQVIHRALTALPVERGRRRRWRTRRRTWSRRRRVFGPKELARLGRRILDVVAPEIAEEAEARRLAELEANAADRTRLTMRRQGDGTTRISGRVPDATATRLATYLEAEANPRKHDTKVPTTRHGDPFTRLPYPKRLGQALCRFLESLDPTRLPVHGGDATTRHRHDPARLAAQGAGTADLLGAGLVPGR